jgi:lipid-A-disaccharide synthase
MQEKSTDKKTIMIVAGENSGDMLAASLVEQLKQAFPNARFIGVAGEKMLEQGVKSIFPLEDLNVMGFVEVLPHLKRLFAKRDELVEVAKREKIDCLITVDFQDFNASLAKKIKAQCKVPCIHYVSPTVWAWRRGRIHTMAGYLDHLLALFPFEPEMYYGSGLTCSFVGHPIAQQMKDMSALSEKFNAEASRNKNTPVTIALLPGSRSGLIKKLLPTMLEVFTRLSVEGKVHKLCIPVAHEDHKILIKELAIKKGIKSEDIYFVSGAQRFEELAHCKVALVASGTSNLEFAMMGIPMLVVYKLNNLSYWLLKPFVTAPYASPVNWVAGKKIIPELIQYDFTEQAVLEHLRPLLNDSVQRNQQEVELKKVREALGESQDVSASEKAAKIVAEFLI